MKQIGLGRLSAVLATLVVIGLATSASAAPSGSCPSLSQNLKTYSNVGAFFTNSGKISTYTFFSVTTENPANGVPGLVKYCVYPDPAGEPDSIHVSYDSWISGMDATDFMFGRPGGNKTNIPLDGKTVEIGTATWTTLPTDQIIVLHIADSTACKALYGGNPSTCFVLPRPGPVCNAGDGNGVAAYNAIPFGGVNCSPPSHGFEANATNEFGDEVTLARSGQLISLNVLFGSFGCSVSGHWNTGDCVTASGDTFDVPITAKIYAGDTCTSEGCTPGGEIASVTKTQTIPYRPTADPKCTGTDAGKWFNPLNGVAGKCQNSIATVLTFTFEPNITLNTGDHVIWTVQFNTSHSGYSPIGEGASCFTAPGGCGYDSLNVGAMSYLNAPYSGTDVSTDLTFMSWYDGGYSGALKALQSVAGWTDFRPLGEIIVK